ncbi:unnamed protein product, partial [Owenia fusiformis]
SFGILTSETMKLRSGTSKGEGNGDVDASSGMDPGMDSRVITIFGKKFNFVILVTHFNIFLYAACFWIQTGTLPYLTKKLGVDAVIYGYLQTTFAVVQLCGGPLYGRFGDLFGGQAALVLAFGAAAISYAILGVSYSIPVLFLSRLPSVFMHAMQGGQMVVTDMADSKNRADALGKLGLSYGIGMVVGPFIGGLVTKYSSEQTAALVAAAGSVLSILIVLIFIPKQTKMAHVEVKASEKSASSIFSIKKIMSLLAQPGALVLLTVKAVSGVPIGIFQSMFAILAMEKFGLAPEQNGFMMSYVGVITMIMQGFGLGILTKRFKEMSLITLSSFVLVWAYLLLAFVQDVTQLCLVMFPLCFGLTIKNVIISSALTHTVPDEDTGAMLGLNMAVNSLIRTVSPTVGGIMLNTWGYPSFGYVGFVASSLVFIYLYFIRKEPKDSNIHVSHTT